jgi:hypothetical protein
VSETVDQPINPTDIMAAHTRRDDGRDGDVYCADCILDWPCESYRLAEALRDAQATVQRVESLADRAPDEPGRAKRWVRVVDLRAALAGEGAAEPEPFDNGPQWPGDEGTSF